MVLGVLVLFVHDESLVRHTNSVVGEKEGHDGGMKVGPKKDNS